MAETVATAAGIAGIVGVFHSLLKCYEDFLTARDFGDDFAVCQLRVALLENSTVTWAIAVGLRRESGEPGNEFLVQQPTEERANLVKKALSLTRNQLDEANKQLNAYTIEETARGDDKVPSSASDAERANDEASMMARVANKVHRTIHRQHDAKHPGTLKRTAWALVDKAALESTLEMVTILVDRLNSDFAPVNRKQQLDQCCGVIRELKLSDEELDGLGTTVGDKIFEEVVERLERERQRPRGNNFGRFRAEGDSTVSFGDYYSPGWDGSGQRQSSRNDTFEDISVTGRAFASVGDTFGGTNPLLARIQQQSADRDRRAESGGSGN